MDSTSSNASKSAGRRQFLKSLFGLSGVLDVPACQGKSLPRGHFYWADLRTGQVGFPTGASAEPGLPGSLMKVVCAAALRSANLIAASATFECAGMIASAGKKYTCQRPHGRLSLPEAIGLSCNVFFVQAARHLPGDLFLDEARRFGLASPCAGYPGGPFPSRIAAEPTDYVLGLMPDLKPSPLQILRMAALVAVRGDLVDLHSAESPDPEARPFRLVLDDSTWETVAQGMRICARQGTASKLDPHDRLKLAAKTGTAPHGKTFQSYVAGFFPYDRPRHAFCARALSGTSQDEAVPLAREYLFASEWP